jgi:hypothetical protein
VQNEASQQRPDEEASRPRDIDQSETMGPPLLRRSVVADKRIGRGRNCRREYAAEETTEIDQRKAFNESEHRYGRSKPCEPQQDHWPPPPTVRNVAPLRREQEDGKDVGPGQQARMPRQCRGICCAGKPFDQEWQDRQYDAVTDGDREQGEQ